MLLINWITRETAKNKKTGIQWTLNEQLEDLVFADDVCSISATRSQMQNKTEKHWVVASKLEMYVNVSKPKVLKGKGRVNSAISLGCEDTETVAEFCYLGSVIRTDGG